MLRTRGDSTVVPRKLQPFIEIVPRPDGNDESWAKRNDDITVDGDVTMRLLMLTLSYGHGVDYNQMVAYATLSRTHTILAIIYGS